MKVAVVHNRDGSGVINRFGQVCPEKYGEKAIIAVLGALQRAGHDVLLCEGDKTLLQVLERFMPPDHEGHPTGMVFNMAYGIQGNCRYTHVPAMLEMAGVPYTGSDPLGHALALDKVITKDLLRQAGIPTPNYCVMRNEDDPATGVRFPVIVKPRHESTSFGLQLVTEPAGLRDAVNAIVQQYQQDALVEEYIDGREVCVALLGNGADIEVFPLVEQDFGDRSLRLMTWEDKAHKGTVEPQKICPANISRELEERLRETSLATFHACHCRDYARVDIRIDRAGNPYVLEINSMASLGLTGSYVLAAQTAGYTMDGLIARILDVAHLRYLPLPASVREVAHWPIERLTPRSLNGQVFDVLGKVQFGGKALRDLLIEAIRYGERPEVRDRLNQIVANALDRTHLQELMEGRALAHDTMPAESSAFARRWSADHLSPDLVRWLRTVPRFCCHRPAS